MPHHKDLRILTGDTDRHGAISDTALTVWSIPQFEQFQRTFSHGLGQLQHHLSLVASAHSSPTSISLLISSLVSITRAMSNFLQRRFSMAKRLQGLGRVVETESSTTWYSQPDTLWLRKAIADLKAKCDAFSWVVLEICRADEAWRVSRRQVIASTAVRVRRAPTPRLRSYNSFSSLGSETPCLRSAWRCKEQTDSSASSPALTNPFSDTSSLYSTAAFSTGPSSLNPNSPVDAEHASGKPACADACGLQHGRCGDDDSCDWHTLSAALRDLSELDLSTA